MEHYPLFWMRSNNLGDALSPILYEAMTGRKPTWSDESPKILATGSLVHEADRFDIIWGSGILSPELALKADETTRVRMVRGPLTKELLERKTYVPSLFGDPALLLRYFFPIAEKKYEIGFVPHYSDASLPKPDDVHFINVMSEDPLKTVEEIASCEAVISSSLHGIIVAEAYDVPAVWVKLSDNLTDFKFYDYYLGTKRKGKFLDWRNGQNREAFAAAVKSWKPPKFNSIGMFADCPFDWRVSDFKRWSNDDSLSDGWESRLQIMAKMIVPNSKVLDCGAGKMRLKDYLPEGCEYTPLDIIKRCDETFVLDLNASLLGSVPQDTIVFAGVLEFIYDIPSLIAFLPSSCHAVIASYAIVEKNKNRQSNGWVNDYTTEKILSIFHQSGFSCSETAEWLTQSIFKFERRSVK